MSIIERGYTNLDFFDTLFSQEVDLSLYLKRFSTDDYTLKFSNIQPLKTTIKNIFEQSKVIADYKTKTTQFQKYKIQPNEKLEDISYKLYETIDFWWIVAIFNNIRNPFYDMPLTEEQVVTLAKILSERESKYPENVYYLLINEVNEGKREISVPRKEQIPNIVWAFREDHNERVKTR